MQLFATDINNDGRADIVATSRGGYKVYSLLNIYPLTATTSTTTTTTPTTTTTELTTTSSLCIPLSAVKSHVFSALTLIGTIRAVIYSKYGVEYEDGELKTSIASTISNSNVALHICGGGMVGCADEICNNKVLKTPDSEFCICDDLGIITNVPNVFDYLSH
ncbi:MAG: FG-GAP repeat protein [Candidatus Midichloria mitochondrii]|uniref:Uncharacterized protein n=1 Tax=Midichloria mitochondrii (strain IricVA) TaxID=696127 RepID=F7XWB7_MIDMI|nr:hypothetical protein midi_00669 [Candidatus Midichloria mitochondrii IricVA]MDJ1255992.1 hypothetical protein [Candidatus Midichloria mitochondrii]MDJ1287928.1 hypothetical protein [Candidatus Midichloria mitochondrii]